MNKALTPNQKLVINALLYLALLVAVYILLGKTAIFMLIMFTAVVASTTTAITGMIPSIPLADRKDVEKGEVLTGTEHTEFSPSKYDSIFRVVQNGEDRIYLIRNNQIESHMLLITKQADIEEGFYSEVHTTRYLNSLFKQQFIDKNVLLLRVDSSLYYDYTDKVKELTQEALIEILGKVA